MDLPLNPQLPQQEEQGEEVLQTGMPAPEKIDARWLFDFDFLWLSFEANLRGGKLMRNSKTEQWEIKVPAGAKPFMNDKGVKDVMAVLRANVNMITGSSIYEEDRILTLCRQTRLDFSYMLHSKRDEYELEAEKYPMVVTTLMNAFESNLRKSMNGTALKYSLQAERILETRTQDLTPQRGWIRKIFG